MKGAIACVNLNISNDNPDDFSRFFGKPTDIPKLAISAKFASSPLNNYFS